MGFTDPQSRESALLSLWEEALGRDRWQREDALLGGSPGAPRGLGARNLALLNLRNRMFDRTWPLQSDCPACGEPCAFEVDGVLLADELAQSIRTASDEASPPAAASPSGAELRAPTVDDLIAAADTGSAGDAARIIVARCLDAAPETATDDIAARADDELDAALDRLDPAAVVSFALQCPACAHGWSAVIDIGEAVWAEVVRAAEALMVEVDALARAYGWSEREVLRLSPARRAAYIQLVAG